MLRRGADILQKAQQLLVQAGSGIQTYDRSCVIEGMAEPPLVDRLEDIIERMCLERLYGKLVMRRDKDNGRHVLRVERFDQAEPSESGHLDVQEDELRSQFCNRLHRFDAVAALADHFYVGFVIQHLPDAGPCERLVIDDECAYPVHHVPVEPAAGPT